MSFARYADHAMHVLTGMREFDYENLGQRNRNHILHSVEHRIRRLHRNLLAAALGAVASVDWPYLQAMIFIGRGWTQTRCHGFTGKRLQLLA